MPKTFQGPFATAAERDLARRRVNKGTRLLDDMVGEEWVLQIQMDGLDLSAGDMCVVASISPLIFRKLGMVDNTNKGEPQDFVSEDDHDYAAGCYALGIHPEFDGWKYGFCVYDTHQRMRNRAMTHLTYPMLQYAWEIKIQELQRARAPKVV